MRYMFFTRLYPLCTQVRGEYMKHDCLQGKAVRVHHKSRGVSISPLRRIFLNESLSTVQCSSQADHQRRNPRPRITTQLWKA